MRSDVNVNFNAVWIQCVVLDPVKNLCIFSWVERYEIFSNVYNRLIDLIVVILPISFLFDI